LPRAHHPKPARGNFYLSPNRVFEAEEYVSAVLRPSYVRCYGQRGVSGRLEPAEANIALWERHLLKQREIIRICCAAVAMSTKRFHS
jgi:hypothetical protein